MFGEESLWKGREGRLCKGGGGSGLAGGGARLGTAQP